MTIFLNLIVIALLTMFFYGVKLYADPANSADEGYAEMKVGLGGLALFCIVGTAIFII